MGCDAGRGAGCREGECHEYRMGGGGASGQGWRVVCDRGWGRASHAKVLEMKARLTKESLGAKVSRFEGGLGLHLREIVNVTWTASNCIEILKEVYPHHNLDRNRGGGADDGGGGDVEGER